MTPIQCLALLVLALVLWRYTLRIVCWSVFLPMLLLAKAMTFVHVPTAGAIGLAAVSGMLRLDEWIRKGNGDTDV